MAKLLNSIKTSRSTVDVALGVVSLGCTEALREDDADAELAAATLSAEFESGALDSGGGVEGFASARLSSAALDCDGF